MAITLSLCCNDQYGSFTGRALSMDFDPYELSIEDTLWPQRGVVVKLREEWQDGKRRQFLRIGRDTERHYFASGMGGNIFWRCYSIAGVDAIGIMNYMMRLKYWSADSGECYLFEQFDKREPINPRRFFAERAEISAGKGTLEGVGSKEGFD